MGYTDTQIALIQELVFVPIWKFTSVSLRGEARRLVFTPILTSAVQRVLGFGIKMRQSMR